MDCGVQVFRCSAFVKAGDYLEAIEGKRPWNRVRERCGKCAEIFARKTWPESP